MAESFEPWYTLELQVKEGQEAAFLEIFKDACCMMLHADESIAANCQLSNGN